jgi:hypothetical protein
MLTVGVVAALALAGCAATPTSPAPATSGVPNVTGSTTPSQPVAPSATPASSPTQAPPPQFVATGSMHTARDGATATLLPSGKVLIAGGERQDDSVDIYASAELYDPATGKFANTGSMAAARHGATAVLLADGRVLVAGGDGCADPRKCTNLFPSVSGYLTSAEIYDPASGKFSATGSMTKPNPGLTSVVLPDGRVLIVGSWPQLYDPASGKFVSAGKQLPIQPMTAALLPNGKVLMTGDAYDPTAAMLFDVQSNAFTTISLSLPAGAPSATYNGQIVNRFRPSSATLLKDGRVLLYDSGYLETYDPSTGTCADAGFISPGGGWEMPTATVLPGGQVLFAGGVFQDVSKHYALVYDPAGGGVRTGTTLALRDSHTATLLPDGSVLIAGGEDKDGNALSSAELFKP